MKQIRFANFFSQQGCLSIGGGLYPTPTEEMEPAAYRGGGHLAHVICQKNTLKKIKKNLQNLLTNAKRRDIIIVYQKGRR